MRITNISILVVSLFTAAPLWAQPAGELVGCITDAADQRLPHVTVVVRTAGTKHTTLANAEGCYGFKSLPPSVYRVTVRLTGFDNQTRDNIKIEAGRIARLDFQLGVSAICECIAPPTTLLKLWENADSVVHLRITNRDTQLSAPPGFFMHSAAVLEALKPYPDRGLADAAMTFMQGQASGEPDPYYFGEEFVVFLRGGPSAGRTLYVYNHSPWVFSVEDGGMVRSPFTRGTEMRLDDLLSELRALSAGR